MEQFSWDCDSKKEKGDGSSCRMWRLRYNQRFMFKIKSSRTQICATNYSLVNLRLYDCLSALMKG